MKASIIFIPSKEDVYFGGQPRASVLVDCEEYGPTEGVKLVDIADYIAMAFADYGHQVLSVTFPGLIQVQ